MARHLPAAALLLLLAPLCAHTQTTPAAATAAPAAEAPPPPPADPLLSQPPSEMIGDLLVIRNRYLAAIHVYEQLPPTASVCNKLGIAALHMYMYDRARQSFQQAIKLNPKSSDAYNNLGTLAHTQGDTRTAEKMYKKALHIRPDSANVLQNLGTLYYSVGKFKKGSDAYAKAIKIDPEIMERSQGRGIQANARAQNASEVHYHMAVTYAQAGNRKVALDYLRKAIGEGFHDSNRMMHEKEFADLRTSEAFLKMVDDLKKD